jgi:glycosyltransferase involved in cell wall biosynthesis
MDASFFVSNFIMHRWKQDPHWYAAHPNAVKRHKAVLPNPIRTPLVNTKKYRDGLPDDAIVLGRVGRADYFDPIALEAFAKIERSHANVYYFVVNPCDQWKATVQDLGIKNVHFFSPIKNDVELSEFYNSIDIFAHARADGETFGCAIAEAMMHGVPVVTHEGSVYQAQKDTIADAGFCVKRSDVSAYHHVLHELVTNGALRKNLGDRARQHAEEHYEARRVVSQLKQHYERVLHGLE